MPRMKLTALAVARLTPPKTGQVDYFDAAMPAFGVRMSLAGARTYFVMLRVQGKLARLTIGKAKINEGDPGLSLKEARERAGEWIDLAARGIDPRQQKAQERQDNETRARNTFKAVAERFMRQHVTARLATATQADYRRVLFGADTAAWANRPVSAITRADVRAVLDGIVERGHRVSANNMLAYLGKFFNWCAEKDLLDVPPTARIKKPAPTVMGERTLTEAEIAEVWQAFEAKGDGFCDLFKLLLLTGQRRGEVGGMRRAELSGLDGDRPAWEIPGGRTKNGRPHIVPLSPLAVSIIAQRPVVGDDGLLFTNTGHTQLSGFTRARGRIEAWINERREQSGLPPMPAWTLHDLRRTMVTMMNERLGIAPHVVEACVNHVSGSAKAGVAGVYNKALYLNERRVALTAWAEFVGGLVDNAPGATDNVVKFRG